jgi:peptidoglycan/xylan/chitin deacetylase (PgdA/CDA1 family)
MIAGVHRTAVAVPPALAAATAATAATAAWTVPALAPLVPALAGVLRIPLRSAHEGTVALTFDDGPHPGGTPRVLELLRAAGASATFFLVGEQVRRSPGLAAEIAAAGHAVAVHCDRHRNLLRLPPGAVATDLDRAAEAIAGATGTVPALHRAPYGIYSWPALRAVRARGWTPVLWSRWGRDWRADATPASVYVKAAGGVAARDILLLHDADDYSVPGSWRATVGALPAILDAIGEAGLRHVALRGPADVQESGDR